MGMYRPCTCGPSLPSWWVLVGQGDIILIALVDVVPDIPLALTLRLMTHGGEAGRHPTLRPTSHTPLETHQPTLSLTFISTLTIISTSSCFRRWGSPALWPTCRWCWGVWRRS